MGTRSKDEEKSRKIPKRYKGEGLKQEMRGLEVLKLLELQPALTN